MTKLEKKILKQQIKNHFTTKEQAPWSEKIQRIFLLIVLVCTIWGFNALTWDDLKAEHRRAWTFIQHAEASWDARKAPESGRPQESHHDEGKDGALAREEGGEAKSIQPARTASLKIIQTVAAEEGIDWKILAALHQKETSWNCSVIGDTHLSKASVGCYQISRIYHPEVTDEQAMDLVWSSHWTAKRLKAKAAVHGWDNAIAMHNGSPSNPAVQEYLSDVRKIIESL